MNNKKFLESEIKRLTNILVDRNNDIESMSSTIGRLKESFNDILDISIHNESSLETIRKIEIVAEKALGMG